MEIILIAGGLIALIVGLISLSKRNFSEQAMYSWRMLLFAGGIAWLCFYFFLRDGYAFLRFTNSGYFSLVLGLVGLAVLIWGKVIAMVIYKFQIPILKLFFGKKLESVAPWIISTTRWVLIPMGIGFLLGAYASYFGPINL
jgi:hypothetical protein